MKLTKEVILAALSNITLPNEGKSIVESGAIKNVHIFGTDVELDVEIQIPTLQYKKRVEVDCIKAIHDHAFEKSKVKVNLIVNAPKKTIEIKGNAIPGVKNIIAISSGKGGVGKSTIAANFAVSLVDLGYKVGVIDADIYGPSMHIMFGLEGAVPEAINIDGKSKIKPLESYGVKLLSIGFFAQSQQAVVWRGPMASKALNQLLWDTHWGELDFLVVDLPPGTGDIHLSLVQSIPLTGAVVVSTPQNIALADARKGVNMFQMESINVPVLGIVENMAYFTPEELPNNKYYIFGKEGAKGLAEQLEIELLAQIPLVQSVREAADAGRPAVLQGTTPIALELLSMTKNILASITKRNTNLAPTKAVELTNSKGCSTK
ncbi:MAG: Mrp/NBP35 family ATP-binding protein [Gammaproteobacteria bacterium]|jgi:ATP-binding protein involved in chromosome partitioning|nr:MAG: chromosome partitioning protein [Cryomorphaceae bacterium BACL11 MAG-121015-bin20]KRO70798.1 MAG: chromosome partitioning protein [Cryomorphaceae bacterium BACL11 MAG-121128-bin16]MBC8227267.1 Mrp/NBP35 family ATP-binding protein [Gammaproteobacteria bacterium]